MGAPPVDTCTRLDRLDHLLVCLGDALRRTAEDRENDGTRPTLCNGTRNAGTGQSGHDGGSGEGIP